MIRNALEPTATSNVVAIKRITPWRSLLRGSMESSAGTAVGRTTAVTDSTAAEHR